MLIAALKRYIEGPTHAQRVATDLKRTNDELYQSYMVEEDLRAHQMKLKTRKKRLEDEMIHLMEAEKSNEASTC